MSIGTNDIRRFTRGEACPVCGGCDDDPRGQGRRCHGFASGDWVQCSREEHAGHAKYSESSQTYAHRLKGDCPCGVEHAPGDAAPARRDKRRGTIDRVYPYRDAAGKVVHETVRFKNPKGFSQRRPLGNGRHEWSLKEIATVLYRLPELLAADPAAIVWVCEGEKDCEHLALNGLVATTNPMGAGKWRDHYSDPLRGRHVVIVPDNDDEGHKHAQTVARSLYGKAASVRVVELPGLPHKGDASDFLDAGGTVEQLGELAVGAPEWASPAVEAKPSAAPPAAASVSVADSPRESQAQTLLRLADAATMFHDPTGRTYAAVPINGHVEVHEIASTGFKRWLKRCFYAEECRPPSAQALQDALGVLDARATYDGPEEAVYVRSAERDDRIYIDLGDPTWRAVEVDADGWRIVADPPVRFRRPSGMRPLPDPVRGGTIDRLKDHVNIESAELVLLVAWLAAALRPTGPYPILVLTGEQGSAKSTQARLARRLTDPHACPLRCEPKEARDLMVGAVNGWVVALDNLSTMLPWLSDALCRLSTGGGFATRALYTNDEETFLDAVRPVILTGITDFVSRGDLIDRSLFLHLPVIPEGKRRVETAFWRDFEAEAPRLLGALLDAMAGGLRMLPEVKPSALPRMADFAVYGEAVSRALGNPPDSFLAAYNANRHDANESAIEDSPVAGAVKELASRGEWCGTASELLTELSEIVGEKVAGAKHWPRTAKGMSGVIRRLAPSLRMVGIQIEFGERTKKARPITVALDRLAGDEPSPTSPASSAHDSRGPSGDGRGRRPSPTVTQPSPTPRLKTSPGDGGDGGDVRFPSQSVAPGWEVFEL